MAERYDVKCPVGRAMNAVGDRWTIMILRDLFTHEARRFHDLVDSLPGLSPNTLSARLKALQSRGIIERRFYNEHPPRAEYMLTPKGRDLGPVVLALKTWGNKYRR